MYTGMLHTHTLVVLLFIVIYLIKTVLLFTASTATLERFTKKIKIPEMIISVLFLATGIYLAYNTGNVGNWLYIKLLVVFASIPLAIIAFKRRVKVLSLLSLVMLFYAYGISESKSPTFKRADLGKKYADITGEGAGAELYKMECSKCHGIDGRGVLSGAKDLTVSELSTEEKIGIISNGKNAMIAYEKIFTAEQIRALAEYVDGMAVN
jgi:uncharacterized membrane protein SirB2